MIKCFLSHSSKDKDFYVRKVAENIKREAKIFDEDTFEEGMSPIEEIVRCLDETSLFVFFISDNSLNSEWVKIELSKAKALLDSDKLERIYPIIIDKSINYEDARIPLWMKESLNIQHIVSPIVAARKITSRLIEISWKFHPRLKERQKIFVGRNDLIKEVEERLDDFTSVTPSAIIASGLTSIGRRTFLKNAMIKSNMTRESYDFPIISLSSQDSIEDFILKINDLGIIHSENIKSIITGKMDDKVQIAKKMAQNIVVEKERILIEDMGVIVQNDGTIVDWFQDVISEITNDNYLAFCIASKYRPRKSINHTNPSFYVTHIYELDKTERSGLLVRYSKYKKIDLSQEDYSFFAELLTGFPEQVIYAVDLIEEAGVYGAKKKSHTIQQYSSDKAKIILDNHAHNEKALNLIYLIAKFEFISYETLFNLIDENSYYKELESILNSGICERLGTCGAYIRINEVIRDYISRSRFNLPTTFDKAIEKHVLEYVTNHKDNITDLSDYMFSVQEAVFRGLPIPEDLLIPSILIKTIKKLYDEDRNYPEATVLCERVLAKDKYIHRNTIDYVRFIKCQCLARLRNRNFFGEVKLVQEPDKSFLYGFYYRISGELERAEENFKKALTLRPRDPRSIGELALVYMQTEEYDLAFDLAKQNYSHNSGNLINANNYFSCLIHKDKNEDNRKVLEEIIRRLSIDTSDRAQEMVCSAKARLMAYYNQNYKDAFALIEEAIERFDDVVYPILTKAELAVYFEHIDKLREAVTTLEKLTKRKAQTYRTFIRYKAILLAFDGNLPEAKKLITGELSGISEVTQHKLFSRLEHYASKSL